MPECSGSGFSSLSKLNERREEMFFKKLYTGRVLTFEGWRLLLELASPYTVVLITHIPVFNY
jgi:hypothetical protein